MLKAGALYYAVAVSLLIGLVSASLIMLAYQQRVQSAQLIVYDQLVVNAHSALQWMAADVSVVGHTPETISLFEQGNDSVTLWKAPWGVFARYFAKAHSGQFAYTKTALAGTDPKPLPALYLADHGKPVSLSGGAKIKGDALLPSTGAKRAYIEGRSFLGNKLVEGITANSEKQLPILADDVKNYQQNLSNIQTLSKSLPEGGTISEKIYNGFSDTTILLPSHGPITISATAWIKGNIIIRSAEGIRVKNGASVEDVILQAPVIVFENGFSGTVQAFATDSIVVHENVKLQYPSALVLENTSTQVGSYYIKLGNNSAVGGMVLVTKMSSQNKGAAVYVEPKAVLDGIAYVAGKISLQGKIVGSLYCEGFYLRTASSVYENYLLDGVIDKTALHPLWQQPPLFQNQTNGGYMKWLY